jgi:molybdopterin-binding protein
MPRKAQGWITFQSSDQERQILEQICQQTQRTKTEVLREMLRTMGQTGSAIAASTPTNELADLEEDLEEESDPELTSAQATNVLPLMKISARNILKAKVKQVVKGTVNAEVTLVIAPGIELVSVIADTLQLKQGKSVFAVIKSNNVMLAEA